MHQIDVTSLWAYLQTLLQVVSGVLWFGRWPVMLRSAWNQTLESGKITKRNLGPMAHNGKGGYVDLFSTPEDGQDFCAATVQAVSQAVQRFAPNP
jgi:hypothetical protein